MKQAPLAIFLSPHFDDIALSCAGMAARLSKMGVRCVCLTVFTAPAPGEELSAYAQMLHGQWEEAHGSNAQPINEVRREEERQAMRLMGLETVWLDLPDAPYRQSAQGRHFYTSDEDLMGTVAREENRSVVPLIAGRVRQVTRESGLKGRVRVFAPLGVGHHVDHQLTFRAARSLGPRYGVLYYEDFPYVTRPGALQERLQELGLPARPRVTNISDLIGLKIAAIARYRSQVPVLFKSGQSMPEAVRSYAETVAGAGVSGVIEHGERFWFIPPSYVVA